MKKMGKFTKGLLIYGGIWMLLIAALWFVVWNYAAAYEMAQPVGAINAYVENELKQQLAADIEEYSAANANDYQSAEEISAVLTEQVLNQEWKYRKSKEFKSDAPVYTMYCGDTALATAYLQAGTADALDFGLVPWEVLPVEAELSSLERSVTVIAPADCDVKLNGHSMQDAAETRTYYPAFAEYDVTIKKPFELKVYTVNGLVTEDTIVQCIGHKVVQAEEADTWYVLPEADDETMKQINEFAPQFVDAYLRFTSNAGSFGSVQRFLAPEGELVDRLRRSLDGMSWVHYTTGKVLDMEVSNIVYYGNVVTYDAAYELKLKSGDMAGNMHVVMVQGAYGWRVSDIELF